MSFVFILTRTFYEVTTRPFANTVPASSEFYVPFVLTFVLVIFGSHVGKHIFITIINSICHAGIGHTFGSPKKPEPREPKK